MGIISKAKKPKGRAVVPTVYAKGGTTVPDKKKPPKKPGKPRLGLPLRQFAPRVPHKELS
jgi:hypothetical protein